MTDHDDSGIFDDFAAHDDGTYTEESQDSTEKNAKLLLELSEGRKLSEIAIQDITGCRNVCIQVQSQTKDTIIRKLNEHEIDSTVIEDVLEAISDDYQHPFLKLSSSYLREKYYKENFPYLVSCFNLRVNQ